jgi:hypothetical protein
MSGSRRPLTQPKGIMRFTTFLTALAATAAFLFISPRPARAADRDWVELGSRKVDFKGEHDIIEVGKSEGKFTKLRFKVEDGDLRMEKIKVTFANGEKFEPETKAEFKEGSRSHEIDLPGSARTIKKIDFDYRSERKREPATIVVYGKEK